MNEAKDTVGRLKDIHEALSQFESEMDYVEFETSADYQIYKNLIGQLRAVIEKGEVKP